MSTATSSTFKWHWYASVAVVIFLFVIVGLYSMSMARNTTGYDEEQGRIRAEKLAKMQALDEKTLNTADWIDKDKGVVRIPVNEAMTQEVAMLTGKAPAMGVAIPGTAPAAPAPAATTAGSTPAAASVPAPSASGRASNNAETIKPTK